MKSRRASRFRVIGCIPFQVGTGFALPIFVADTIGGKFLIQEVDEASNSVVSFKELDADISSAILVESDGWSRIGEDLVFAFISDDQCPHVGSLLDIRPILLDFRNKHPKRLGIILQINELIGSTCEKRNSRAQMAAAISLSTGHHAAKQFYHGSVLQVVLWQILVAAAPNAQAAARILKERNRLLASVDGFSTIRIKFGEVSRSDFSDLTDAQVSSRITEQFDPEFQTTELSQASTPQSDISSSLENRVSAALSHIRNSRKQEERISIILRELLNDRQAGTLILERYQSDRAGFATSVLRKLRNTLDRNDFQNFEAQIANLLVRLFIDMYPMRQGDLLLQLSRYLSGYRLIRSVILARLSRSNSVFLEPYRADINKFLSSPN